MWILTKAASLIGISVDKILIYAGLAVTGLIAIATVLGGARKAGRDAERARQQKHRLEAVAAKNKLDREFDKMDSQRLRERAARWQN
jgi:hypothetical protein